MPNSTLSRRVRCASGNLSASQVNSGTVVIPAEAGRTVTVVDGWLRALGGNAGGATSVDVTDTNSSPVVAGAWAVAALTQNTVARVGAANVTSTNIGTSLTYERGVRVIKNGSDLTGATSVDYCLYYLVS